MLLIAVAIVLCIALLFLGILAPRLSRRAEGKINEKGGQLEERESQKGAPGRMAAKSTDKVRQAADNSSEAVRSVRGE